MNISLPFFPRKKKAFVTCRSQFARHVLLQVLDMLAVSEYASVDEARTHGNWDDKRMQELAGHSLNSWHKRDSVDIGEWPSDMCINFSLPPSIKLSQVEFLQGRSRMESAEKWVWASALWALQTCNCSARPSLEHGSDAFHIFFTLPR